MSICVSRHVRLGKPWGATNSLPTPLLSRSRLATLAVGAALVNSYSLVPRFFPFHRNLHNSVSF